jgi:hypothetical protein
MIRTLLATLGLAVLVFSMCCAMSDILGLPGSLIGGTVILTVTIRDRFDLKKASRNVPRRQIAETPLQDTRDDGDSLWRSSYIPK